MKAFHTNRQTTGKKQQSVKKLLAEKTSEEIMRLPVDQLLKHLNTSESGLTSAEANRRLRIYGVNDIETRKKRTNIVQLLFHLRNPLVALLLFAGIVAGVLGDITDAIIIFTIVILSAGLDVYQESKAEKAAEKLKQKVAITTVVFRDSKEKKIPLSEIVPGDIVQVSAGTIIPADARIIVTKDLLVDQSALTGESFPVEKTAEPIKSEKLTITELSNFLFLGTSVVSGTATIVVVKTGFETEYGKIAKKLSEREVEPEFEKGLKRFGYLMLEITIVLVLFVFFINALFKRDILESFLFALALAVGLTPELLPMILTLNLSKGAIAMSEQGVIVKRLAAIQDFGSMDILCTDKTGTLTENKISLQHYVDFEEQENEKALLYAYLNSHFETGLKSPFDEVILKCKNINVKGYKKVDEIPFDFSRRRVSVIVERDSTKLLITKGAPEEIFKVCSSYDLKGKTLVLTNKLKRKLHQKYQDLSKEGYRILAIAYLQVRNKTEYSVADEKKLIFLGFLAFLDPPKEDAKKSLHLLEEAGIELKILTGDNEFVTRKVCEQLNFEIKDVLLGNDISKMSDSALAKAAEKANVFARVTPEHKNRIINALRHKDHVVGFLGDGVNDSPSIKAADVGISVNNAVDVAKESADIILMEKRLSVLKNGVLEGRRTFGNTMKYIMMGVSSNFGNMFSVAGASIFLPFLPMLPKQILLNNLMYDISESTIPTDNVDADYVKKPKKLDISFIRKFMLILGPVSSLFDFLTFFVLLYFLEASTILFQTSWFIESLITQTLVVFVIRTRKPFYKSKPSRLLIISSLAVVFSAIILPFTPLNGPFQFVQPPLIFFAFLSGLVLAYVTLVEIIKTWFFKKYTYLLE